MKRCPKTVIDKLNKLWKWKKPTSSFKKQYKNLTGLVATEVGMMTDEAWDLYLSLFDRPPKKEKK